MQKIEDVESPVIGAFYLVRSVRVQRGSKKKGFWFPVVDEAHRDGKHGLDRPHHHVDWRFVPEKNLMEQRDRFNKMFWSYPEVETKEYATPVMESDVLEERYLPLQYLRDHKYPDHPKYANFGTLKIAMKDVV